MRYEPYKNGFDEEGFPLIWRDRDKWPRSVQLEDTFVACIREALSFGPLSLNEIEEFAHKFKVHPKTIFNIATGASYKRVKACPKDHPLRLALNEKAAADQRLRYRAQKHRKAVGDLQDWKCMYCGTDVVRGGSALDHINPINPLDVSREGGTSERENLQILCKRCNTWKNNKPTGENLDAYMARKVQQVRALDKANEVLITLVKGLLWIDTQEAPCPWCESATRVVETQEVWMSSVWKCKNCRRLFRVTGSMEWGDGELHSFLDSITRAIYGSWYVEEEARALVKALMSEDLSLVRRLVTSAVGDIQEVKRRRHQHKPNDSCWCEYGLDGFKVIQSRSQTL